MKRDIYKILFFEKETGFPKQVELFAGSFAEAKLLFGKMAKGQFTIHNMTSKESKEFNIK
jgi:hypothetical protein